MPQSMPAMPLTPPPTTSPPPEPPGWLEWWLNSSLARFLSDPIGTLAPHADTIIGTALTLAERYQLLLAAATVLLLTSRWWLTAWHTRRLQHGACWVEVFTPPAVSLDGAAQVWSALHDALRPRWHHRLTGRTHLTWELVWTPDGQVRFGLWVPGQISPTIIQRAIEGGWPGARTQLHTSFPALLPPGAAVLGGGLRLGVAEWFALKHDHRQDPLRAVIAAAEERGPGEHAYVQMLARPVTMRRLRRAERAAASLRTGKGRPSVLGQLFDLIDPSPPVKPIPAAQDPARGRDVTEILAKLQARPHWEVLIRYAVSTSAPASLPSSRWWRRRARLRSRAHALASAFGVYAGRNHLRRHRLPQPARTLAARPMGAGSLVSLPELVALAHLPLDAGVPGVVRAGAKVVPPAPHIPARGKVLGDAQTSPTRPIALAIPDARYHVHLMGATGTGKSTLLANLVLDDVAAGRGAVIIDPKGDLVWDILDRLPEPPRGPLVIIDPDETTAPPSLNVLTGPSPELTADHLVGIFRTVFAGTWGPRTDDLLRSACLTLLHASASSREGHAATLADLPGLLTDPAIRARYLARIPADSDLGRFWTWYERFGQGPQTAMLGPLLSRLRSFLLRPLVRDTIGTSASSFELGEVLDGGLLLARLPKGLLGEDTMRLLGSLLVTRTWQTATHRARHSQHHRHDASLIVDECHNFLTLPVGFEGMAAEARSYRLSLVLAHQHLGQLPTDLAQALGANARTKVWFTSSPEDAHQLARHVTPELTEHDLSHLGAYQAAARLVVNGLEAPACTLTTRPMPPPISGRARQLRAHARATTGRTRTERHDQKPTPDLQGRRGIRPDDLHGPDEDGRPRP